MPDIVVNGARLHVEEYGEGAPIVLLHGALATGEAFRSQRTALRDLGRLVLVDQRGHGRSAHLGDEVPWESFTYDQLVADARALLDVVSPDAPVHLVGVSMGGMVSARLAAESPERVASVALLSTAGYDSGKWRGWFASHRPGDMRFARLAARWHGEPYWREFATWLFAYLAKAHRPWPERLAVRGLVMQGDDDELLAPDECDAWVRRFDVPVTLVRAPGDHQFFADGRAGSQAANAALRAHLSTALRA